MYAPLAASHSPHAAPKACGPAQAAEPLRILVVGDSVALGIGAADPADTLAGLLRADRPDAQVTVLARSGALLADVPVQLAAACGRFDAAVLVAGGNDILLGRGLEQLARDAEAAAAALAARARIGVWMGIANIGLAPLFIPPWSWWMAARARRARQALGAAAAHHGLRYLDFFREAREDPFSADPARYFAADGIHPSSSSYRYCYAVLRTHLAPSVEAGAHASAGMRLATDLAVIDGEERTDAHVLHGAIDARSVSGDFPPTGTSRHGAIARPNGSREGSH
ncbi:GDSL-type esterase/lipase family protein [Variovorax sp. RCC_210]|uniref:GDSL-type esterase/lipase family protein n=1 Tax=Variovorax sp. RCC_210 TaxID=3239217 RepID=UPI0014029D09